MSDQTPKTAKLKKQPPKRLKNSERRTREYLTEDEVEQLRKAARQSGRNGLRDDTLILLMFRHGLRVGEIVALRWEQVDFKNAALYVQRLKQGRPSTHPLYSPQLRALRQLKRMASKEHKSPYVFLSERLAPLTERSVRHIVARAGKQAELPFPVHPHMLRHSTGFYLANKEKDVRVIQHYLGHSNIKNTVIYTELSAQQFKNLWEG